MTKKNPRGWSLCFSIIYISFLSLSLLNPSFVLVSILKVGSIFLCFIFALIYNKKDKLLIVAMLLTFVADVILAINNIAISGVIIFCLAQSTHFIRLSQHLVRNILSYATIVILMLVISIFRHSDMMFVVGGIYALLLLSNLFMSFMWFNSTRLYPAKCAFFGFLLFLACDLCVATSYLSLTEIFPAFLYPIANYCSWVFYLPAQILISNSPKYVLQ